MARKDEECVPDFMRDDLLDSMKKDALLAIIPFFPFFFFKIISLCLPLVIYYFVSPEIFLDF